MAKSSRKVPTSAGSPLTVAVIYIGAELSFALSYIRMTADQKSFLASSAVTTCFIFFFFLFFLLFLYLKTSQQERMPGAICALAARESHMCFCGSAGAHDGEARGISKAGTSEPAGCVFPLDSRRPTCLCVSAALKWLLPCRCARKLQGQVDTLFTSHAFTRLPGQQLSHSAPPRHEVGAKVICLERAAGCVFFRR